MNKSIKVTFDFTAGQIRVTPAMACKVTKRLWDIEDIVNLLDEPSTRESN